jgi:hypothetical protein
MPWLLAESGKASKQPVRMRITERYQLAIQKETSLYIAARPSLGLSHLHIPLLMRSALASCPCATLFGRPPAANLLGNQTVSCRQTGENKPRRVHRTYRALSKLVQRPRSFRMFMHALDCLAQTQITEPHQNSAIYKVCIHCGSYAASSL